MGVSRPVKCTMYDWAWKTIKWGYGFFLQLERTRKTKKEGKRRVTSHDNKRVWFHRTKWVIETQNPLRVDHALIFNHIIGALFYCTKKRTKKKAPFLFSFFFFCVFTVEHQACAYARARAHILFSVNFRMGQRLRVCRLVTILPQFWVGARWIFYGTSWDFWQKPPTKRSKENQWREQHKGSTQCYAAVTEPRQA